MGSSYKPVLEEFIQKAVGEISTVGEKERKTQEHANEEIVIAPTKAVHYPNAMMIMLCYTHIAYSTVLAPRRLDQLAGLADLTGLEEDMVVRVLSHMSEVITRGNHRRDGSDGSICHDILYKYGDNHSQAMREIQAWPGSRHEYAFGDNHDNHIEDLRGVNRAWDCRS